MHAINMVGVASFTESTSTKKDIEFFKSPRARSGYLFTAPSLQTSLLRRSVFQSGAVQRYPDLALGPMKNPLYLHHIRRGLFKLKTILKHMN